jgi:two-component system response regulator AtoC
MNAFNIRILIADDEKNLRTVLEKELSDEGYDVQGTGNGSDAAALLEKDEYDVLLLDQNMPGMDGMEVLKKIKSQELPTEVIILTGHGTVSTAVQAMKLGAYDYLTKPFKTEELKAIVERAYEKKKILNENLRLKTQIKRQSETQGIVTESHLMLEILETVKKVAVSDFPIVIYGESGTGKELVARAIHDASPRADGPFIPLNCGAIPQTMIESELFGHEKGAFTGAHERKLGLLEIAGNGTLFLDEIGELPLSLQVKLLRVIETSRFFRVGGVKEVRVSVKFISASNKDIKAEVEKGAFRADLYYRISALTLHIPPLRERREDIPLLIEHFRKKNPAFKQKQFRNDALKALSQYAWPGNVRELQNVVHRTFLLSHENMIAERDLPADLVACRKESSKRLFDVEKKHILGVLRDSDGHRARAAEILGIDPKTLYRKLRDYGVKE